MVSPLVRILRLRTLLEDVSRAELGLNVQQAARIEGAQRQEREVAQGSRRDAFAEIVSDEFAEEGDPFSAEGTPRERWILAEAAREMAEQRAGQLHRAVQVQARKVRISREAFFESRKERQQVEAVVEAEKNRRRTEQDRRTQKSLDDWFAVAQMMKDRKRQSAKTRLALPPSLPVID